MADSAPSTFVSSFPFRRPERFRETKHQHHVGKLRGSPVTQRESGAVHLFRVCRRRRAGNAAKEPAVRHPDSERRCKCVRQHLPDCIHGENRNQFSGKCGLRDAIPTEACLPSLITAPILLTTPPLPSSKATESKALKVKSARHFQSSINPPRSIVESGNQREPKHHRTPISRPDRSRPIVGPRVVVVSARTKRQKKRNGILVVVFLLDSSVRPLFDAVAPATGGK